ncbi:helix-turn-helix domain-containing protein [Nonomuraea typhae]|uniref:helix-turn-helix domain-containing protein n=1 Tax=Nonomuraea typhae TaxID=2603600 RepID=UPI002483915E|nr:helix-turn-helix transcriptional regulator [Nonomuraea typhae]
MRDPEPVLRSPRRKFGAYLREYRTAVDMRQKDLADALGWSLSKISMVERGERPADEEFARQADRALQAGGALLALWRETADSAARWPVWVARLVEIEQRADMLRVWQPLLVPGLLQTEEYARAVFRGKPGTTPDLVEKDVATRMERQSIIKAESGPILRVVLDEGVLTQPIGSEAVMAEQMAHLAAMDEHPRVNIHVLPRDSWVTTGLQGSFILASMSGMPDMAYIESITLSQITADAAYVLETKSRFEVLHGDALSRRASLQLIKEMERRWT